MISVFIEGAGIAGPGLNGWTECRAVLAGMAPYRPDSFIPPPVALLPPAERRRAGAAVRVAIAVSSEALAQAGREPRTMAMVFASSGGDGQTVHEILSVLATETREVSPTRFHNSVHNAPAGYWSVATGSCEPSSSLCAYDASFAAGLLDAAALAVVDDRPVTLAAYDLPYPAPLHGHRTIEGQFALALVLSPRATDRSFASLRITAGRAETDETVMTDPALERLRANNPAARGLPLLAALASGGSSKICLRAANGMDSEIMVDAV